MGFLDRLFGKKNNFGDLLVPCQNPDCKKIFKESAGRKERQDLASSGFYNLKCPFCREEFAVSKTKLEDIQVKLHKQLKI